VSLTARRVLLPPALWLKDFLWRRAQAVPSLDLRFADNKSLVDSVSGQNLITFTRVSSATFIDSTGTLQTAATNVPRFDHNPTTGESLGLLVEEQRTNSIRNNTMVGAVAGTPGTLPTNWVATTTGSGVTREIVGTGTENGIAYIDIRYAGIATANLAFTIASEPNTSVAAANGQSWTYSAYVKIVAGSFSGFNSPQIIVEEYSSGGSYLAGQTTSVSAFTTTLTRVTATRTNTNASTAFEYAGVRYYVNSGNTVDMTLRIGLPQLEQGSFATSAIPTTTAAATRAADVASITGAAFSSWYRQDEGTVFADFVRTYSGNFTNYPNIYQFNDGTDNNEITLIGGQNAQYFQPSIRVSATAQLDFVSSMSKVPGPNKYAHGFAVNSSTFAGNGTTTATDTSVSLPAVNRLTFGVRSGQQFTGCYRRFTYWPRAFNSTLQFLTQ
jgi:hypothetical protein